MKYVVTFIIQISVCLSLFMPFSVPIHAQSHALEVSGWIPYWRTEKGIASAKKRLHILDVVHPFSYTVKTDGSLYDAADLTGKAWKDFFKLAKKKKVKVVPTIMWSNRADIHRILRDERLRERQVREIASLVKKHKFDGIDIDYENKLPETGPYFSAFLTELNAALGNKKMLSCTLEARTPPESLYTTIPNPLVYANDYAVINDVCDRIQIMAYDQGRADIQLNNARRGMPYTPVADTAWVEKVLDISLKTLSKEKVVLAVPTYGYEYEITVSPQWFQGYRRLWSFNPGYAVEMQKHLGMIAGRGLAGEAVLTYRATSTSPLPPMLVSATTDKGHVTAAQALAYANATGNTTTFNYMTWSDAEAVRQKIDVAKRYGVRGIALFKIDGGEDQDIWKLFE